MLSSFALLLVGRGLKSDLATKISQKCGSLKKLKKLSKAEMKSLLSVSEISDLKDALKRKPIARAVILRLIEDCDWKCCFCWDIDSDNPLIIHHIEGHAKSVDDSYENLILLCPNHHAAAHTHNDIARAPFPPELLRFRKIEWIKVIADFKAGLRKGPGREDHWLADFRPASPPVTGYFTGRESEIEEIKAQIFTPSSRGGALVGMAGVGKTTLSLKLAEICRDEFSGGIFWADLSDENGDIVPILLLWLECCGITGDYPKDAEGLSAILRGVLAKHVRKRGRTLFMIDDAREEWLSRLQQLIDIIPHEGTTLVTTRENAVPIALGLPIISLSPFSNQEALLFLRRESQSSIVDAEPDFAQSLVEILGALPLALTLIAKQIALHGQKPGFSLESLFNKIEMFSEKVLSFPGHPGLSASLAISYKSLDLSEQRLFRWLGAFAMGPIRMANISSVTGSDLEKTENQLDQMVRISMLNWGVEPSVYRLHPVLHHYARHLLRISSISSEFNDARKSHLEFYAELVNFIAEHRSRSHDELQAEFSNIKLAINNGYDLSEWSLVSDLMQNLWAKTEFFQYRGYEQQAIELFEKAILASQKIHDPVAEAQHLGNLGAAQMRLGDHKEAKLLYEQAINIVTQLGGNYRIAAYLQNLGVTLRDTGNPQDAIQLFYAALDRAEKEDDLDVAADALGNLGGVYRAIGDYENAIRFYTSSLEISEIIGDDLGKGNNLSNIGLVYIDTGALNDGEQYIRKALTIAERIGDNHGLANRLGHLGRIIFVKGQTLDSVSDRSIALNEAQEFFQKALKITREAGDKIGQTVWLGNLGNCFRTTGDVQMAVRYYEEALALASDTGNKESEGLLLFNLGVMERDMGKGENARSYISQAIQIFKTIHSRHLAEAVLELKQLG